MQNELLDLIDQIDDMQAYAEMEVCRALLESYSKSAIIIESCSENTDISSFDIFQEGVLSDSVNEAKGDSSENILKRIFLFIPRLIAAFIRNLRAGKKNVEKKVKEVEAIANDLKDVAEHPEKHVDSSANKNDDSTNGPAAAPDTKKPEPEVTERRGVPGASYGDDDKAKRANAAVLRSINKATKTGTMFLLPERSETNGFFSSFDFYVDKDIRIDISTDLLNYVSGLNKETVDFQALMEPVQDAVIAMGYAFSSFGAGELSKKETYRVQDYQFDTVMAVGKKETIPSLIKKIRDQLKDADAQLSKVKKYAKETKFSGQKTNTMFSEVVKQYRVALDWMEYVDHTINAISERVNTVNKSIQKINTNKKTKIDGSYLELDDRGVTIAPADKRALIECANRIQRIVGDAQKAYQDIIAATYHSLDVLRSELFGIAKKNNIKINEENVPVRSPLQLLGYDKDNKGYLNYGSGGYGTKTKKVSGWF